MLACKDFYYLILFQNNLLLYFVLEKVTREWQKLLEEYVGDDLAIVVKDIYNKEKCIQGESEKAGLQISRKLNTSQV